MTRHELPTHLNVQDKLILGLSIRQALYLASGLAGAYAVWHQWPALPLVVRAALAGACLLMLGVFSLVRPSGRGLDEWSLAALHYAATPKTSVWRRAGTIQPAPPHTPEQDEVWAEFAPPFPFTSRPTPRAQKRPTEGASAWVLDEETPR